MRYCKKCTMPDTRPGITFDAEGVCSACRHYENRKNVDWDARFKEFEAYCDKYRGMNGPGGYDCAVAVSGGKDSHFQVWMLKEVMHMNPILFSVEDNFPMTQAGIHNLKNISEEFGCTIISCKPNIKVQKILMRKFFEKYGKPTWYVDRLIYTFPLHMAAKFNTPMLCYGENVSFEYGGNADKETYSAMGQIENGVAVGMPMEELLGDGVTEKDLSLTLAPSAEERAKLDPFYMSYFVPWNSYKNYQIAKAHGFHDLTHEWDRTHHAENFDQIDSRAYLVHSWLKYPKFGHAAATDYTARYIRYGMMTREEAIPIIKERDGKLDPLCVRDFCEFCGYTETEFWAILDKFYNRDLFEKNGGAKGAMRLTVMSFGFKHGIPADADLVFDVRFLPNPYYIEELKPQTGNDKGVQDYVMSFPEAGQFLDRLEDMLHFLIPNYIKEGKYQLVVAIGCTGGKHRSVTVANALYETLEKLPYTVRLYHRDIGKDRIVKGE